MPLLVIPEILGLFVQALTANGKYYLRNWEKLLQPIRMKLSKKQKVFSQLFAAILKSTSNFEHLEKMKGFIADLFS